MTDLAALKAGDRDPRVNPAPGDKIESTRCPCGVPKPSGALLCGRCWRTLKEMDVDVLALFGRQWRKAYDAALVTLTEAGRIRRETEAGGPRG